MTTRQDQVETTHGSPARSYDQIVPITAYREQVGDRLDQLSEQADQLRRQLESTQQLDESFFADPADGTLYTQDLSKAEQAGVDMWHGLVGYAGFGLYTTIDEPAFETRQARGGGRAHLLSVHVREHRIGLTVPTLEARCLLGPEARILTAQSEVYDESRDPAVDKWTVRTVVHGPSLDKIEAYLRDNGTPEPLVRDALELTEERRAEHPEVDHEVLGLQ